jgi:hypothetical protein
VSRTPESQRVAEFRERVRALGVVPEHVHGTNHGYNNYKCRCELCRTANRDKRRKSAAKIAVAMECFDEVMGAATPAMSGPFVQVLVPRELWQRVDAYRREP